MWLIKKILEMNKNDSSSSLIYLNVSVNIYLISFYGIIIIKWSKISFVWLILSLKINN